MKKIRCFLLFFILVLLFVLYSTVSAEVEAIDMAKKCIVKASNGNTYVQRMFNTDFDRYWPCTEGDSLTVQTPKECPAQGFMFSFLGSAPQLTVTTGGQIIAEYTDIFESSYIPFPEPVTSFTVTIGKGTEKICFNRLCILSEGKLPRWVQCWKHLDEPADLMLVVTHPDDELLWFGGLLPTYAGEYQKKVQVVYMVGNTPQRRNELLAGLWTCGVRYYPEIGSFPDRCGSSIKSCLSLWGEDAPKQYIVAMIRKHRPAVVVTQDIYGEYGHAHHCVTVQATIDAVIELAGNAAWDTESVQLYGIWQPHKLYLHLWESGQIIFDWRQPLSAFDGETSLSVAKRAFKQHVSQQTGKYHVTDSGKLDSRLIGLYWSDIGPDEAMNDLMEHIN